MRRYQAATAATAAALAVTMLAACADSSNTSNNDTDAGNNDSQASSNGSGSETIDWPTGPVEFVIPTAAGGGLDTTFRQIQPFIEEELGQPIAVDYREGGQFAIGTTYVAQNGADCEPFMFHAIPDVIFSYLTRDVTYTYDDFYPLAGLTTEPSTLWVANDAPWETLEEFVAEAESRPGQIRISVSNLTSADHLAALRLQEHSGAEFNIVSYDGGGPARNAVVAGEVEAAMGGVFAGQGIADRARALGVFQQSNDWKALTHDAPAVNEALGTEIDDIGGRYGFFAARECKEQNPEKFQVLADAIAAAVQSDGYREALEELGEQDKVAYAAPDEFHSFIEGEIGSISAMIDESPEIFGVG